MKRIIEPELLDSLPEDHPDALRNRQDIKLFNALMGNFGWFERVLTRHLRKGDRVLEIGAGAGDMGVRLAGLYRRAGVASVSGLDLWSRPPAWPIEWPWHRGDLRTFNGYGDYTVVLANLILHQFEAEDLTVLGNRLRGCRLVVACEPARRYVHLAQAKGAAVLGINAVSRHDAVVSVRAGFREHELPEALGLRRPDWDADLSTTLLGGYRMVAARRAA